MLNVGPQQRVARVVPSVPASGPAGDLIFSTADNAAYIADNAGTYQVLDTGTGDIGGSTGATDNAVLRADGTGGKTLQNSGVIIDDSNNISGVGTLASGIYTETGNAIGATSTDGVVLQNTTAAINGTQQWSPRLRLSGQGFGTVGALDTPLHWIFENQPVQGSVPSTNLVVSSKIGAAAYKPLFTLSSAGQQTLGQISATTGKIALAHASSAFLTTVQPSNAGAARTLTCPDTSGTLTVRTDVPYDLACQVVGVPDASAVVLRFIAVRAFTLSASGQQGTAGTAATAQTDFIVAVNGTTKATLRFAASGTTISVVGGTEATIAAGDVITITAPGSADATLANIGFTLTGVLI